MIQSEPDHRTLVKVALANRAYDIHIGSAVLADAGQLIAPLLRRPKTVIVTDQTVADLHLDRLQRILGESHVQAAAIVLPAGEQTKSFRNLADLCDQLLAAGVERKDRIIALGGGVIGDITGFAAAILRRGVDFIQIPTTLLAQVDSSVGGKTGINSAHGKNLIGAFHQPLLVLADTEVLDTLLVREMAAGYAEVAKYGLLGDAAFFGWLEKNGHAVIKGGSAARLYAITKSCQAKAAIVAADETEQGERALLNLGHTFGHALESSAGYNGTLLHGEAVAIGMVQAFRFSEMLGLCATGTADRVEQHLSALGLPTKIKDYATQLPHANELLAIMRQDKKADAGKLNFILARAIGEAFIAKDVDEKSVLAFLEEDITRT